MFRTGLWLRWTVPTVALLVLAAGALTFSGTVQAHGTGNTYGNNIEFGQIAVVAGVVVVEDADTIRKVSPRNITISVGQTVTFHVNDGHQPVVLNPGVALEDLGSEGVNLDGTGPQTLLPPETFPNGVAASGLSPRSGPGRWDNNPASCPAGTDPTEVPGSDRPQVFDKQGCPTAGRLTPASSNWTTIAFTTPGRYAFICNFPAHFWDEGIEVTGPLNPDAPIIVNGYGMHGFIYVE